MHDVQRKRIKVPDHVHVPLDEARKKRLENENVKRYTKNKKDLNPIII
jgi:hypothetical protein